MQELMDDHERAKAMLLIKNKELEDLYMNEQSSKAKLEQLVSCCHYYTAILTDSVKCIHAA